MNTAMSISARSSPIRSPRARCNGFPKQADVGLFGCRMLLPASTPLLRSRRVPEAELRRPETSRDTMARVSGLGPLSSLPRPSRIDGRVSLALLGSIKHPVDTYRCGSHRRSIGGPVSIEGLGRSSRPILNGRAHARRLMMMLMQACGGHAAATLTLFRRGIGSTHHHRSIANQTYISHRTARPPHRTQRTEG